MIATYETERDTRDPAPPMPVLTILQPWIWVFAHAWKRVENRDWRPPEHLLGQDVALHAGVRLLVDNVWTLAMDARVSDVATIGPIVAIRRALRGIPTGLSHKYTAHQWPLASNLGMSFTYTNPADAAAAGATPFKLGEDVYQLERLREAGTRVRGAVVSVARLVGYRDLGGFWPSGKRRPPAEVGDVSAAYALGGHYFCGEVGWCFDRVRLLRVPVPCRGMQGVKALPSDVASAVRFMVAGVEPLPERPT